MPIVTATVIAISAAIATTTVATVAAAAVAVGTLVGTVGLGLSVIGMATGNETLSKIGGYMGMAGGVLGLGGGLAGGMAGFKSALSTAWDDGVGSLFTGTKPVGTAGLGQEAMGRAIVANANPQAGANFAKAGLPMDQGVLGRSIVANTKIPTPTPAPKSGLDPGAFATTKPQLEVTPDIVAASDRAKNIQALANANPSASTGPAGAEVALDATKQAATMGAPQPGQQPTTYQKGQPLDFSDPIPNRVNDGSIASVGDFFKSMPDWAKFQLATTGLQGLGGALGSWFESSTAEQQMELQKQAQMWNQQFNTKNQQFDQKSRNSAPLVTFGGGALSKPAQ